MCNSREELRKLPLAERLELVEELSLTQAQMDELDRRFADYEANPDNGVAWEEVRDRLRR